MSFAFIIMSRNDSRELIRQRTADEEDARERERREAEDDADQRHERAQAVEARQASVYRKNLKHWDELAIISATAFELVEPKPSPVGS